MLRRLEDLLGVVDADRVIARRMKDEQRLAHPGDRLGQAMAFDICEKVLLDPEAPPGEHDLGLALGLDLGPRLGKEMADMRRVRRCADRDDELRFRNHDWTSGV